MFKIVHLGRLAMLNWERDNFFFYKFIKTLVDDKIRHEINISPKHYQYLSYMVYTLGQ